jgi:hypothetical protein
MTRSIDTLRRSLHHKANDLKEWFQGTLEVREMRTTIEIESISTAIQKWSENEGFSEDDFFVLWEIFVEAAISWLDKPESMPEEFNFHCTPPLAVPEFSLFFGLLLAQDAVNHFQSKSHKRHLLATHLLANAIEAQDYWLTLRGMTLCRNPDTRFTIVENKLKKREMNLLFRETRSNIGRNAANVLHNLAGGSREKKAKILSIWATGKYSTRDICAEQECASLEMSFSTARKALRNSPTPNSTT